MKPPAQEEAAPRALWYLAPGGLPTPATAKRAPAGVAYQCREGDASWSPLGPLVRATTQPAEATRPATPTE